MVQNSFQGPALDLHAFQNLLDMPITPSSRSEVSLPSLTDHNTNLSDPAWQHQRLNSPVLMADHSPMACNSPTRMGHASSGSELFHDETASEPQSTALQADQRNVGATSSVDRLQLTKSVIVESRRPQGSTQASKVPPRQLSTSEWSPHRQQTSQKSTQRQMSQQGPSQRQGTASPNAKGPNIWYDKQRENKPKADDWEEVFNQFFLSDFFHVMTFFMI